MSSTTGLPEHYYKDWVHRTVLPLIRELCDEPAAEEVDYYLLGMGMMVALNAVLARHGSEKAKAAFSLCESGPSEVYQWLRKHHDALSSEMLMRKAGGMLQ